ncbi:MAG TPA: penicillin-binding transpeptidase domain-containing protein [Pirellulales bacterium]|jgi:penicillin-binding protein 2
MARPDQHFEWHQLVTEQTARTSVAGTRSRLRWLLWLVALAAAGVFLRAVQLEWTDGAAFRAEATRPIERPKLVPAPRGRILARDGSVLAADTRVLALAVHYRWFEEPANPAWLARQVRARLSRSERRDKTRVAAAERAVLDERARLHDRLARLCGQAVDDWRARASRVQQRIEMLAEHVNQRRLARFLAAGQESAEQPEAAAWFDQAGAALAEMLAPEAAASPAPVVLAEQEEFHPLLVDIPPEVAAEIAAHGAEYPGTKIIELVQRDYPAGALAAHVVGQLGPATTEESTDADSGLRDPELRVGRSGIERAGDVILRGRPGLDVQRIDHRGHAMNLEHRRTPETGADIVLAIDPVLQRAAESLLDDACRPLASTGAVAPEGGAAVVMDVETGELWVSASVPRFDPRLLAGGDSARLAALFAASNHPLVDRVTKMAIPPGSVFKTLTAVALLEESVCTAEEPFFCQGFLDTPDSLRCLVFRQQGVGHGDVTLADALTRSCNVYFFHHAGALGIERLAAWSERFGFGRPTGVESPDESSGSLPRLSDDASDAQRLAMVRSLAIGQGTLRATPLQIVRLMAALANGGRLLPPSLKKRGRESFVAADVLGLHQTTLDAIRQGLCAAVADSEGTAYASARLASVAIAGKTGTAQTSGADHAWFAGFAPADTPRVAFVVVLEHGGPAEGAARVARELVAHMHRLGRLVPPPDLAGH